eukprot:Phypoly_transcript_20912.p1 GENE.Phypoly_transcript_20912~~Phypoly_transcript_20912.p1  ORF type:complete len:191 (+),score=18.08 Phypoly_transcript_20912:94-666(+)
MKTREIRGVYFSDGYNFGSPHVGNLDFKNHLTSVNNAPYYNTCRLYRVYNLNDPIARIPFGFDDPNILAVHKGPSGMDPIDYCHFGVPILLHQHPFKIPNDYPDFLVDTPKDLVAYWAIGLSISLHVFNLVEWGLSWLNVLQAFKNFSKERNVRTGARLAIDVLETSTLLIFHTPSAYCRNLTIKEELNL